MYFTFYLLMIIFITNAQFSISFIKCPFQNKLLHNDNNSSQFNKIRNYFKTLNNHKNNKEIRKPAILELPVEFEDKWEEGEIPWDFVDMNVTTPKKYLPVNDADRIAFLFT